jgi:hypothetical protein
VPRREDPGGRCAAVLRRQDQDGRCAAVLRREDQDGRCAAVLRREDQDGRRRVCRDRRRRGWRVVVGDEGQSDQHRHVVAPVRRAVVRQVGP